MKVVASDFDNTLYVKDKNSLQYNINSVKKFIEKGNDFIIITGRSYSNIKKVLNELDIPYTYLVCQDGANIFNKEDICIKSNKLDIRKSNQIEKYLQLKNLPYTFESAFNDNDNINNAVKITVTVKNLEEALKITEEIKLIENIYAYVSTKYINIIDNYVNKSSALKYLVDNKFIDNNITVLGDDINDYEMLQKYDGRIMKKHHKVLDTLNKKEINSVSEYLDEF